MKNKFIILVISLCAFAGCVTRNPDYPAVPDAPAYLADRASVSNSVAAIQGLIAATPGVNAYAVPASGLVAAGGGLLVAVSSLVAAIRSNRKASQSEQKASQSDKILTAVITGVDVVGDKTVKQTIQKVATSSGVETDLYNKINS